MRYNARVDAGQLASVVYFWHKSYFGVRAGGDGALYLNYLGRSVGQAGGILMGVPRVSERRN